MDHWLNDPPASGCLKETGATTWWLHYSKTTSYGVELLYVSGVPEHSDSHGTLVMTVEELVSIWTEEDNAFVRVV